MGEEGGAILGSVWAVKAQVVNPTGSHRVSDMRSEVSDWWEDLDKERKRETRQKAWREISCGGSTSHVISTSNFHFGETIANFEE